MDESSQKTPLKLTPDLCDFCGAQGPSWKYPAKGFIHALDDGWESEGPWYACEKCHALIDSDAWETLTERALKGAPFPHQDRERTRLFLLVAYGQFNALREGPPVKLAH
jgi:hypothetical protein